MNLKIMFQEDIEGENQQLSFRTKVTMGPFDKLQPKSYMM